MTGDGGPTLRECVERDGHVLLRGAVPEPVVRRAQPAACAETERVGTAWTPDAPEVGPVEYLTAINLSERSPELRDVVRAEPLARWAAAALGVDRVRLLYDQLFTKPPGAIFTMWHQDQVYLPIDTSDVLDEGRVGMIRAWVNLTPVPAEVGGLHFVDGSHRLGPVDFHGVSMGPPGRRDTATIRGCEHSITDYGAFGAGDATLHAGYTVHGSRANPSGPVRYAVAIAYVPDGTRVAEPADEQHELAIALHAPGRRAGDLIDSEANPVLWPAEAA